MTNTVFLHLLTGLTIYTFCGINAIAQVHTIGTGDMNCPKTHRLMSASFVKSERENACISLLDWGTYRLSGWASLEGNALNCKINYNDRRTLKHSLCTKHQEQSSIRGVLLFGGFRTQNELNMMSPSDWREALITELSNRTLGSKFEYTLMDNAKLAGAGDLLLYLIRTKQHTDQELANLTIEEIRGSAVDDVFVQTGISRKYLAKLNDTLLIEYLKKG